jgi:hypothetical protein
MNRLLRLERTCLYRGLLGPPTFLVGLVPHVPTPYGGEKGYVGGEDVAGNHTRHEAGPIWRGSST